MKRLTECRVLELPQVEDHRGNLTFIEKGRHVPFDIERVYYLYDVPIGEARGGHGHRALEQLIIAVNGSFNVTLDDGYSKQVFRLSSAREGLFVRSMVWREIDGFSAGSVCLVLASKFYDEADYFREYPSFLSAVRELDAR